jgi:hypothetical protein
VGLTRNDTARIFANVSQQTAQPTSRTRTLVVIAAALAAVLVATAVWVANDRSTSHPTASQMAKTYLPTARSIKPGVSDLYLVDTAHEICGYFASGDDWIATIRQLVIQGGANAPAEALITAATPIYCPQYNHKLPVGYSNES